MNLTCPDCGSEKVTARGYCNRCYCRRRRMGLLPDRTLQPLQTYTTAGDFNVVPMRATRGIAGLLVTHARQANGADAALRWLPEVHPQQVGALVGLLAQALALNVGLDDCDLLLRECLDCSHAITDNGHGKRGLCRPCYDRHKDCGELKLYPPFGWMRADEEAS